MNVTVQPTITHKNVARKQSIIYKDDKVALILSLVGAIGIWYAFRKNKTMSRCCVSCLPLRTFT